MNKIHNSVMSPVVIITFLSCLTATGTHVERRAPSVLLFQTRGRGGEVESVSFSSPVLLVLKCH